MEIFLSQKICNKFTCKICNYNTINKKDYGKHLLTYKHKKLLNGNNLEMEEINKIPTHICHCEKIFLTQSGLWKHKKKCKNIKNENNKNEELNKDQLILMLIKQNSELIKETNEFKNIMMEQQNMMMEVIKKISKEVFIDKEPSQIL